MRSQDMAHDSIRTEQTQLLGLLQERLDEAERAGEAALKLEPHEVEQLCSQAGIEDEAADVFRTLVRSNLVRVRGRWRDGRSAVRAPVYIRDLTERGTRVLAASSAHRSERLSKKRDKKLLKYPIQLPPMAKTRASVAWFMSP